MRVLIAEDEPVLAALLAKGLRRRAMAVDVAHDGAEALERLAVDEYDVLVLDRDLPGVHGDDVCRRLAAERARVMRVGLPDRYVTHGKPALLREEVGLTGEAVADKVLAAIGDREPVTN